MNDYVRRVFEAVIPDDKEQQVREWARSHAYLLIFLAAMFLITWAITVIVNET